MRRIVGGFFADSSKLAQESDPERGRRREVFKRPYNHTVRRGNLAREADERQVVAREIEAEIYRKKIVRYF